MNFFKGVDLSMQHELEALGAEYYGNGTQKDIFEILKSYDVNGVRLRIWVDPYDAEGNPYGGGTNDFKTTVELAKRIKQAGMEFVLDIHYSDFWTDPGKQYKPKAWQELSPVELEEEVYNYTSDLMEQLIQLDLTPKIVQIGNEITNGLLWPNGKIPQYDSMFRLLENGIKAVREKDKDICIILHLDYGGNNELYRNWFDRATTFGLDFDIIGLSYYPFWHGTMAELTDNMADISQRYDKQVMVVETAFGFTNETAPGCHNILSEELAGKVDYPLTPAGQAEFINDLLNALRAVPNRKGMGMFYWEPTWIPVPNSSWATEAGKKYINDNADGANAWANQALFDYQGHTLPALSAIKNNK